MRLDAKLYGLPARTVLERIDGKTIGLILDRKSRIIMADGRKILEKAIKIKAVHPGVAVQLITSAPVCSKTSAFLEQEGINTIIQSEISKG